MCPYNRKHTLFIFVMVVTHCYSERHAQKAFSVHCDADICFSFFWLCFESENNRFLFVFHKNTYCSLMSVKNMPVF